MVFPTSRLAEAVTGAIERAEGLDPLGRAITKATSRLVRPGAMKDVLSGTWMAHPVHPMLTDVAIGAWTSSLVLDVFGGRDGERAADALVLTGVLAAIPTAATGLSDLSDVEDKRRRRVGTVHALGNVTALLAYTASLVLRRTGHRGAGRGAALAGAGIATMSGFLGGHLSFRQGVGVDQTTFQRKPREWTAALPESDLPEGRPVRAVVAGTDVLLYREGSRLYALANRCSHRGGPLYKGKVEDGTVRCPWHLSRFSLEDGSVVQGPATAPQPSFEVRIRDGNVEIRARP